MKFLLVLAQLYMKKIEEKCSLLNVRHLLPHMESMAVVQTRLNLHFFWHKANVQNR